LPTTPPNTRPINCLLRAPNPNRFHRRCRQPCQPRYLIIGRQTDPARSATDQIRCHSTEHWSKKSHRVVHCVSSVRRKPLSQNKSELFILSHPSRCTECLTVQPNNPR